MVPEARCLDCGTTFSTQELEELRKQEVQHSIRNPSHHGYVEARDGTFQDPFVILGSTAITIDNNLPEGDPDRISVTINPPYTSWD